MNKSQIDSDKLQGIIRNPFALYFPIQRASLNYLSDVFAIHQRLLHGWPGWQCLPGRETIPRGPQPTAQGCPRRGMPARGYRGRRRQG